MEMKEFEFENAKKKEGNRGVIRGRGKGKKFFINSRD
jgi:hypothetical protein